MNAPNLSLEPTTSVTAMFECYPELIPVFIRRHMSCVGCSMAPFDTLQEAASNYGLDVAEFILELKAVLANSESESDSNRQVG